MKGKLVWNEQFVLYSLCSFTFCCFGKNTSWESEAIRWRHSAVFKIYFLRLGVIAYFDINISTCSRIALLSARATRFEIIIGHSSIFFKFFFFYYQWLWISSFMILVQMTFKIWFWRYDWRFPKFLSTRLGIIPKSC